MLGSAEYFKKRAHNSRPRFLRALAADVLGQHLGQRTQASFATQLAQGVTRANIALKLLTGRPSKVYVVQGLAKKYGTVRDNPRALATRLETGASERDVILAMVLAKTPTS